MDFTELYRHSAGLVNISPGTQFILTAVEDRLVVRRSESFEIVRTWLVNATPSPSAQVLSGPSSSQQLRATQRTASDGWITHSGWSYDSEYVLAACAKQGVVNVYKLQDEDWNARIEAGVEGLSKVEWAPDGRTIMCFSEWGLRVTMWSLVTGTATYIQFPKYPDKAWTFRPDGRYFVVAERHKSKDIIGVYDAAQAFKIVRHFPVATSTLSSFSMSPRGTEIAIWEGPTEYKLVVVSLAGDQIATFCPPVDPGLGIRVVSWHRSGAYLAVGGWDDKIYVLSNLTWRPIMTLDLTTRLSSSSKTIVWREPHNWLESTNHRGYLSCDRLALPISIPVDRPDMTKGPPKAGTVQLSWNLDGTLLLVRLDQAPTAAFIYSFPQLIQQSLVQLRTVLLFSQPISSASWNPVRSGRLCLTCDTSALYIWNDEWLGEDGVNEIAECIAIPAKRFAAREVRWAADGKGVMLLDRDVFCCAYEVEEGGEDEQS
ncbi:YVTN repeat-like/Quino protein amine dehydrogenase [Auriculariales sp. MPI-PUGE-AT-0066]|nr:YVTN repeat-like/Quino protein amine dehydrogenase [Auriculariales sp. MPI-PUGE-AT-0066]